VTLRGRASLGWWRRRALGAAFVVVALGATFAILGATGATARSPSPGADASPRAGEPLVEDGHRYVPSRWTFALERFDLRLEDAGWKPAIGDALVASSAEVVVNGGFFDAAGRPVGLAVSEGTLLSALDPTLSGGVVVSDGARVSLHATEGFELPRGSTFAIQCRPRLVVDGEPNVKRDDGQRAERTALCIRESGRRLDAVVVGASDDGASAGPSLHALSQYLAASGCEGALNLDGGPSTGAAWREGGAVKVLAPRGPVRHVVAFHRR